MADSTAAILGGAIPVVGGIISGVINNANTDSTNRANQAFQLQQQAQQNQYNTTMWNAQNQYNSPVEAMKRFKEAGLNPNLIYGAGASGATFASAPAQSAKVDYVQQPHQPIDGSRIADSAIHAYNDTRLASANTDLMAKQSSNVMEDVRLKAFQEGLVESERLKTLSELPLAQSTVDLNSANADRIRTLTPYDASALDASVTKTRADTASILANTKMTLDENDRRAAMNAIDIRSAAVNILKMRAETSKDAAERSSILALIPKVNEDTKAQQYDNALRATGAQPHDAGWFRALSNYIDSWKTKTRRLFMQP